MPKTVKTVEKPELGVLIEKGGKKPAVFREVYSVQEPYVYAAIVKDPKTQKIVYEIIEPTLQEDEKERLKETKTFLIEEVDVNLKDIETKEKAKTIFEKKQRK